MVRASGPCDIPGCQHESPIHAGAHKAVCRPTTTRCAPLRCYCGQCPSWTPRPEPRTTPFQAPVVQREAIRYTPGPADPWDQPITRQEDDPWA